MCNLNRWGMAWAICFVLLVPAIVSADYVNPPGWEGTPYFTHQSWEFTTQSDPGTDLLADVDANPYGTPVLTYYDINNNGWVDDLGAVFDIAPPNTYLGNRQGAIQIAGGTPDEEYEFGYVVVPNVERLDLTKEIWIQVTIAFDPSISGQYGPNVDLIPQISYSDPGTIPTIAADDVLLEPIGVGPTGMVWARATFALSIFPQPLEETFRFAFTPKSTDEFIWIDEIDIDTHCVPEPSSLVISLLGLAGLLGLAIRRKIS